MRAAPCFRLLFLLALAASARGEDAANLLRNPGFEELVAGLPSGWKAFVYPAPGAYARLVEPGCSGDRAAALVIASPYRREPDNNWSQHVTLPAGTARLTLSGWVRAEGPGADAFLWLQCWQRRPARMLAEARTAALSARESWTRAEVSLDVPAGTDFVMVRLTLRGVGEGWFDDLRLAPAAVNSPPPASGSTSGNAPASAPSDRETPAAPPTPAPAVDRPPAVAASQATASSPPPSAETPVSAGQAPDASRQEPVSQSAVSPGPPEASRSEPQPEAGSPGSDVASRAQSMEETLTMLREENRLLLEALTALRAQHESVQRDLDALRREIAALRAKTASPSTQPEPPKEETAPASVLPAPPLAPAGSEWDDVTTGAPQRTD